MKNLCEEAYIVGIMIHRDRSRRLIGLIQSTHLDMVLKRFVMDSAKKGFLPMSHRIWLSKTHCLVLVKRCRMMMIPSHSAIGSITYAKICTRPSVSNTLRVTSKYQLDPGMIHWTIVKNILKHLRRTKHIFLVFGGEDELGVKGYTGANFQTDLDDSTLQSG
jgi:hypothetical protein